MSLVQPRTLTAERLREVLDYDPETGVFRWKVWRGNGARCGGVAGGRNKGGYWAIELDRRSYLAHRLAWLYVHGEWPACVMDHSDLDKVNNRIANLREATRAQNKANSLTQNNNKLGVKGVYRIPSGRFRASIRVNYQLINLGTFATQEAAAAAYEEAARKHFGIFARAA